MSSTVNELSGDEFSSKDYISNMQNEKFKAFKSQDLEKGCFNVTFEVDGKILHAHKFILTIASEPMGAMLSDRWRTKDEVIKIETYSYDTFYQFLCFIYSGSCKINRDNAFQLTDMAEYYGIFFLKELCDEALSMMEITVGTIEEMYEHASLYSLPKLNDSIEKYVFCSGTDVYRTEMFLNYKKPFVEFLSTIVRDPDYRKNEYGRRNRNPIKCKKESEFFQSVYGWAEHQVMKREPVDDENFNLQEAVQAELSSFLPRIKFYDMNIEFLIDFAVERGFFLSASDFSKFFTNYRAAQDRVNEGNLFKSVYELVEKQALLKQKKNRVGRFNLGETIKADMAQVISQVKFHKMEKQFLIDFVVKKYGIGFFSKGLSKLYQNSDGDVHERFKLVYQLAEIQALLKQKRNRVGRFNLAETVKADLAEVIPHIEFYKMEEDFLVKLVVEKYGFIFSSAQLLHFFQKCRGTVAERITRVYQLAETQALLKQKTNRGGRFNRADSVKADLAEVMRHAEFHLMDKQFLMDSVVEKYGLFFSSAELCRFYRGLSSIVNITEKDRFQRVYELAEKQALQKQKMSPDDSFSVFDSIKTDLTETLPLVKFFEMDKQFLMDFVVENGFVLSPTDFSELFQRYTGNEEKCFIEIYKLADMQALQKQKMLSDDDDFDLSKTIKADLIETIPRVKFYEMDKQFLMDFVLETGFLLSPTDFSQFYRKGRYTEKTRFKRTYKVAKKQALQKRKMSSDNDNFYIGDSLDDDLAEVIRHAKFYKMRKEFLNDFVVANGLITEEQASHVYDIIFEVENDGQRICGTLQDNIEICRIIKGRKSCEITRRNLASTKRRFLKFELPYPSTPSTVTKMKGVKWYLCFEKDKVLTLKHHTIVKRSDYLLAAMEGDADFELNSDEMTVLTAKCNNV